MIRDLNRINALVVSAGYPIADAAGLLRGSRLRQDTGMKLIHLTDLHLVPPGETLWGLDPFARLDAASTTSPPTMPMPISAPSPAT